MPDLTTYRMQSPAEVGPVVNLICPYGEWEGHPAGVEVLTPEVGNLMVAYFKETFERSGNPVAIDYNHATMSDADIPTAIPAAGWIYDVFEDLEATPPGLYMVNSWTPAADEGIKNAELKFLSPVILNGYRDPVTAERIPWVLYNAAITPTPFMRDKMVPLVTKNSALAGAESHLYTTRISIAAHTISNGGTMPTIDPGAELAKVKQAAGLKPEDDIKALVQWIETMAKVAEMLESTEGLIPAVPDDQAEEGAPMSPDQMKAMEAALPAMANSHKVMKDALTLLNCDVKDVPVKITALLSGTDTSKFVNRVEFEKIQRTLAERDADAFIVKYSDILPPAAREYWRNKAVADIKTAEADIASLKDSLPTLPDTTTKHANSTPVDAILNDPVAASLLGPKELEFLKNKHKGGAA